MTKSFFAAVLLSVCFHSTFSQTQPLNPDSLTQEILTLKADVQNIKLNLAKSESRVRRGIFVSAVGYSTVIAGGLMLGRKRDDLGKALLVTGGAIGVTGTILLVDAFKFLGKPAKPRQK
jgi:hypothetical protein